MEFLQKFRAYLFALKPAPSQVTVKNYCLDVKHFLAWLENKGKNIANTTRSDIQDFIEEKKEEFSIRTLDRHTSSLRKFFQFLKLTGITASSPFENTTPTTTLSDPYRIREFKDYLYVYNAASLTIKNYIIDVRQFLKWAEVVFHASGMIPLGDNNVLPFITNEILEQYRDRLASEHVYSYASINRKLSSLRKYFAWAKSQKLLTDHSGFQINPNSIANIVVTQDQKTPTADKKQVQMATAIPANSQLASPVTDTRAQLHVTKSEYAAFPPIRLIQKISKAISIATDYVLITPLAHTTLAFQKFVWTLKGKPLFTKKYAGFSHNISRIESVKNISKAIYNPIGISLATLPWYQKAWHHARYTRPKWYKKYQSTAFSRYLNAAIFLILSTAIGFGFYNSFVQKPTNTRHLLAAAEPNRILSFQGRLTDSNNNPITTPTNLRFAIYTDATSTGSALLWQEVDNVAPDSNGVFSVLLGKNSTMQQSLFANNANLYLGITVGQTPELTPRQQLATVAYATNAETLQGLPPITQSGAGTNNVVLALDSTGNLTIGASSKFQTVGGAFTLSGDTLMLNTNAGTNGNIALSPDGTGYIDLQKPLVNTTGNNNISSAKGSVEVDDTLAILATASGIPAVTINQNGSGVLFTASSGGISKFTVNNSGSITDANYTTAGGIFYADSTGMLFQTTAGTNGQCLTSANGGTPTWGACGGGTGNNYWTLANGALYPVNTTLDVLFGGTGTSSAKFAFINNASGTPTASISGNLTLNSNGIIQTTNNQGLTIGGNTTGNITLSPLNGTGTVTISGLVTGIVHATAGILSSSAVSLASSDVSGILPLSNGGTNNSLTADNGGIVYSDSTKLQILAHAGSSGQCLVSGGTGAPSWSSCSSASSNWWSVNNGAIYPINDTFDFLLGGTATSTAKFAVLNMTGSGTPTASVSSGLNGNATFITANGQIQTTNNQGLTIGGNTTGNITLSPLNGTGSIAINGTINSNLLPQATDTYNLGSSSLEWNNLYVKNIISTGTTAGFWQLNTNVISPANISNDLAIGGTSTSSAKFQVFGTTGNATTSGNLTFTGTGSQIQTTNNQALTLGGNTTGNIILSPLNGGTGSMLNLNAATLATNQTSVNLLNTTATTITFAGAATALTIGNSGGTTTFAGNIDNSKTTLALFATPTTVNVGSSSQTDNVLGNVTLGTNQSNTITPNGLMNADLIPTGTGVINLGSSGHYYNTIYANNFVAPVTGGTSGFWSLANDVVYPSNTYFDLAVGGTSTSSASFQVYSENLGSIVSGTATTSGNLSFRKSTTNVNLLNNANLNIQSSVGGDAGLASVLYVQGGTGNVGIGTTSPTALLDVNGTASVSSALTFRTGAASIQTTSDNTLTLGGNTTGNISFGSHVASSIIPYTTNTYDLGSSSLQWNNLYVNNIISSGNTSGFWQLNSGALAPTNITNDVLVGGISTSSAKFQIFGLSGNATTSGNLTFTGGAGSNVIAARNNAGLTIGDNQTGNIIFNGGNVGIGTTTPAGKLEIVNATGGFTASNYLQITGSIVDNNNYPGLLLKGGTLVNNGLYPSIGLGNGGLALNITGGQNSSLQQLQQGFNATYGIYWGDRTNGVNNYYGIFQSTTGNLLIKNTTDITSVPAGKLDVEGSGGVILNAGNVGIGTTSPTALLDVNGTASVSSALTFRTGAASIQTTSDNTLTLGGNTTGNISFGSHVASSIIPYTTNTYDLGSSSLQWNNLYINNIYQNGQPLTQLWQLNSGVLSPLNITNDLAVGGNATNTAKFQVFGLSGNATTAGNLTFAGGAGSNVIAARNNAGLTIGDNQTGNIIFNGGNVGIGTNSPISKLQVTANNGSIFIGDNTNTTAYANINSQAQFGYNSTGYATVQAAATKGIQLNVNNNTFGSGTAVTIDTNGFVAIGNTLEGNGALVVNQTNVSGLGDIIAASSSGTTEFKVNNSGVVTASSFTDLQNPSYYLDPASAADSLLVAGTVGIGTTTPLYLSGLDIEKAALGNAVAVVNQLSSGDIFTASSSGTTKFTIQNDGTLIAKKYTTQGGLLYANDTNGTIAQTAQGAAHTVLHGNGTGAPTFSAVDLTADVSGILPLSNGGTNNSLTADNGGIVYSDSTKLQILAHAGSSGQCLVSGGTGAPSWSSCSSASSNWWSVNNGAIYPINDTFDFLLGGTATSTAKFAVLNMTGSGTPTASVSSGLNGNATFITANGQIQTTNNQGLTIGGNTTGNITLSPLNSGTGSVIHANAATIDDNFSTANLFGTPTTITFAGAATALTIGNSGGTTTFAGNIDNSKTTLALFATPTTVNVGSSSQTDNVLGNVTLGTGTGNTVVLNGLVSGAGVNNALQPAGNGTIDLGSAAHYWATVYANNFISPVGGGTAGFWQLTSNVLSPVNSWNDLAVGGNATGSATPFQVFATTVGVATAGTATTSGGLSFRGNTTNFSLLNGSVLNVQTSIGGNSGLATVLSIANNGNITQTGSYTMSGNLAINGGTISTTQSTASLFESGATTINFGTTATTGINIGNASGTNLIRGNITLGSSGSNTINPVGQFSNSLIPAANTTYDLGSSSLQWRNLYLSGTYGGFWQQNLGVVSPTNITDDLAIGGTSTSSAKFQIFGNSGNATTSGNLTFTTNGTIQTTNMLPLVLGSATTGSVQLTPNSTTGLLINTLGNVGINTLLPTAQLDVNGTASVSSELAFRSGAASIQATANNSLTIGGNTTGSILFGSNVASGIVPVAADTYNLGSVTNEWDTLYVRQIVTPSSGGIAGYWQLSNAGVLAPANLTNDLAVGGVSTASAVFQVFATGPQAGTATMSGNLTLSSATRSIGTVNMQTLTLGNATTGSVAINPNNTTGLFVNNQGYVGVGTVAPTTALDVVGDASLSANLNFRGGGTQKINLLNNSSLGFYTSVGGSAGLSTNPALYIANSGNAGYVGLGTTAPQGIFDVAGSGSTFPSDLTLGQTATTNLVPNPSFENSSGYSTSWTLSNSAQFSQNNTATESALFGSKDLRFYNVSPSGTYTATTSCIAVSSNVTYTASTFIYQVAGFSGNTGIDVQTFTDGACSVGQATAGRVNSTKTNQWQRVTTSISTTSIGSVEVQFIVDGTASGRAYGDGFQLEQASSASPYLDGSLGPGYYWTGTPNNSSSVRKSGSAFAYNTINSASGIGAASMGQFPTLQLDQNGSGNIITASVSGNLEFQVSNAGTITASSFQDLQNSAYFLDPAATGTSLTTAGSVGIGTTSPYNKLSVNGVVGIGTTGFSDGTTLTYADGSAGQLTSYINRYGASWLWSHASSTTTINQMYLDGSNGINLYDGTTSNNVKTYLSGEGISYFTAGNVGIGITNPGTTLDVVGASSTASNTETGTYDFSIETGRSGGDQILYMGNDKTNHNSWIQSADYGTAVEPLLLNARGGNVGIGTTSPATILNTEGGIIRADNSGNSVQGDISPTYGNFLSIEAYNSNNTIKYPVVLDAYGGNVGIGTINPQSTLDVNGSIDIHSNPVLDNASNNTYLKGANSVQIQVPNGTTRLTVNSAGDTNVGNNLIIGHFFTGGNSLCEGSGEVELCSPSDKKVKTNIQYWNASISAMATINQLKPVSFDWIDQKYSETGTINDVGFIAQDAQQVNPLFAHMESDGLLHLDRHQFLPYVVKALQEVGVIQSAQQVQLTNLQNLELTQTGNIVLQAATPSSTFTVPTYYTLNDMLGNPITRMGAFLNLVAANLRVGSIQAQQTITNTLAITTNNVSVAGKSLNDYIISVVNNAINNGVLSQINTNTNIISPLAQVNHLATNIISPLATSSAIALRFDQNKISIFNDNNATGSAVTSFDNNGNATMSGILTSKNLAVNNDATISGTLYANNIKANSIEGLQEIVSTLSAQNITNVTNMYFATPSSTPNGENFATGYTASGTGSFGLLAASTSGSLTPYLGYTNIASYSGFLAYVPNLSANTAMFNNGLVSLGTTSLGDTTVTGQLAIGTQLVLSNNSINVLGSSLEIQPLRQGGVNFEGGLLAIDTDGNLTVNGNAVFAKNLSAHIISPLSNTDNLTFQLGQNPTATGSALATSNLTVQNASGSGIFTVDQIGNLVASGAANIAKLNFTMIAPALAVSDTEVIATGSAGMAVIKPHQKEVTIDNTLVTNKSLIYITPVGQSVVTPYLVRQVNGTSFTVGIPVQQITNTAFNWLIVN